MIGEHTEILKLGLCKSQDCTNHLLEGNAIQRQCAEHSTKHSGIHALQLETGQLNLFCLSKRNKPFQNTVNSSSRGTFKPRVDVAAFLSEMQTAQQKEGLHAK